MVEIAWDFERVEAQAKKWQEMASVLANDHDRVAWLIKQISYLSASHMQLQQVCRVNSDGVIKALNKADGIEQVQLIQMEAIAKRLEMLERRFVDCVMLVVTYRASQPVKFGSGSFEAATEIRFFRAIADVSFIHASCAVPRLSCKDEGKTPDFTKVLNGPGCAHGKVGLRRVALACPFEFGDIRRALRVVQPAVRIAWQVADLGQKDAIGKLVDGFDRAFHKVSIRDAVDI